MPHPPAVTCNPSPDGHDHWMLHLLAQKVVALGVVGEINRR